MERETAQSEGRESESVLEEVKEENRVEEGR